MSAEPRVSNFMDEVLPMRWAPLEEESPPSLILRLSAELGHPYATLCRYLSVTRHDAARDNLRAAKILRLSQNEWEELTYGTIKVGRFRKRDVRGHILNADRLCISQPRICPQCLLASGYCRWYWDLSLYCYCHIHRCGMVAKCETCKKNLKWDRPAPSFCSCGSDLSRQQPGAGPDCGLLCSDIIIAISRNAAATLPPDGRPLALSLNSVLRLLHLLNQLKNGNSPRKTGSSNLTYSQEICITAGSILMDWPDSFHRLLGSLQAQRRCEHPNPMRDLFGSNYPAWLDLVRLPEFSFLVAEYQQFLLRSWTEPIAPQGHVFRLVGASSNVLSLAEAARKANVVPACIKDAYRAGKIEGHLARNKSHRRILWLDVASFDAWHKERRKTLERILPCRAAEAQTGFSKATLTEFERIGLIQVAAPPPASKARGLCFDRSSLLRLVQSTSKASSQVTRGTDIPLIALGDAARLYLGRLGLARFLYVVHTNQHRSDTNDVETSTRLSDLKFPLEMILKFQKRQSAGKRTVQHENEP